MAVKRVLPCADCATGKCVMSDRTLAKGSAVRDPGEPLCPSCQSTRVTLIRQVDALPKTLDQIRAKRMVRS